MTAATHLATPAIDPRRYHEAAPRTVETVVERLPVCLYLEVTNRCNLLCTPVRAPMSSSSRRPT